MFVRVVSVVLEEYWGTLPIPPFEEFQMKESKASQLRDTPVRNFCRGVKVGGGIVARGLLAAPRAIPASLAEAPLACD